MIAPNWKVAKLLSLLPARGQTFPRVAIKVRPIIRDRWTPPLQFRIVIHVLLFIDFVHLSWTVYDRMGYVPLTFIGYGGIREWTASQVRHLHTYGTNKRCLAVALYGATLQGKETNKQESGTKTITKSQPMSAFP